MTTATAPRTRLDAAALLSGTTPAPWTYGAPQWRRGESNPERWKRAITAGHAGVIGNVYGEPHARLIAAAPDLAARVLELEEALRSMTHLVDRIHAADASGNNGAVMGEAHLCRYFAVGAEQELATARALLGDTP